jgi:WhiB family redox-sensing transcriptional regulator
LEHDMNHPDPRTAATVTAESVREPDVDPTSRPAPRDLPCHVHDPDLWFSESPADLEQAKALCASCPVQRECLAGALRRNEPCGVWGGQILVAGRVIPFKRPRGRPRIHFPAATVAERPPKYA